MDRVHHDHVAVKAATLHSRLADTQSSGLRKDDRGELVYLMWMAQHAEKHAGTVLLALEGLQKDVQRAGVEQGVHDVIVQLRVHIVQVGLQKHHVLRWQRHRRGQGSYQHAEKVGEGEVPLPGSIPYLLHRHSRQGTVLLSKAGEDGCAGRGDQFTFHVVLDHRQTPE